MAAKKTEVEKFISGNAAKVNSKEKNGLKISVAKSV
jgi:hypothetical protein